MLKSVDGDDNALDEKAKFQLIHLLPNIITVVAICAGMTAIRFGFQGHFERAVQLVLLACVLDGIDGKLARILNCNSEMGAELDSLADFMNFGVVPPLLIYFWALQDMPSAGWIAVLIFVVCCVMRLARFNVSNRNEPEESADGYFTGVPAPAGALLVMMPMFVSFAFEDQQLFPMSVISAYVIVIGLLLVSRIKTWSPKALQISRENVKFLLIGFAAVGAAALTYTWITLVALCLVYAGMVAWAALPKSKKSA